MLYLPLMEPLTELVNEAVWFPIWCERPHVGYWYRLDGRDLLVQSRNVTEMDRIHTYRMTDEYIFDVGGNPVVTVNDNQVAI
jgi:elongation factor P hydroxylase